MFAFQLLDQRFGFGSVLQQQGEKVFFFVLVVQRGGYVEIVADLGNSLFGNGVVAVLLQIAGQGVQLAAKAFYFAMAGAQHSGGLLEGNGAGIE